MNTKRIFCAMLSMIMVLACVGCGSDPAVSPGTESPGENTDTIIVSYASGPAVLDPVMIPGDNATIWLTDLLFGSLMRASDDGSSLEPYLAESYTFSEDGMIYTFKLKEGVKFSDGTAVTAEDWVYSLLRARDTEESNWHASTDAVKDVVALDASTLEITLTEPRESFLAEISMFNNSVQSKAHIEEIGDEANQLAPMGTGPYMIKEWAVGEYILFEKNPHYWDAANVPTQYLRFNIVGDSSARMMQLQSGEADIINEVPFNSIDSLDAEDGISAFCIGSSETQFVIFNCQHEILKDVKVRQALRYATDMQQIIDLVLNGCGSPATSFMTSSGLYYNDKIQPSAYNIEKAKEMLAEAGYPNGFDISIMCRADKPAYEEISTILKEQWALVGVNLDIQVLEKSAYIEKRNNTDFEITMVTWTDDIPHPSQIATHFFDYSKEKGFFSDYENPAGFATLEKALVELNPEKCAEYYDELQQIWFDEVPSMVLYYGTIPVALSDNIHGFVQNTLGKYHLDQCYKAAD